MLITSRVCQCKDSTDKSCWDQQLCLQFYPQHQTFTFPLFCREEEDEEEEENEEYYAGARPDGDQNKNLPETDNTTPRPGRSSCSSCCAAGSSSSSIAARPEPEGVYTFTGFNILGRGAQSWTSSGDRSRTATDNCTNSLHEDDGPGLDPSASRNSCREENAAAGRSSASSASVCAPPTSRSCRSQEDEEQTCSIEQLSTAGSASADHPDKDRARRTGKLQLAGPILCSLDDNFSPDMQVKWQTLTKGKLPVHVKITEGPLASLFIPLGYALQICLGLETCDAEMCMTEILPNAAKHDKFSEHFLIRSPHEKLRFCIKNGGVVLLVMQYRFYRNVELALHVQ